jgi:hypothetical protein
LSDDRKGLWIGQNDGKTRWNRAILESIIAPLWAYALSQLSSTLCHVKLITSCRTN